MRYALLLAAAGSLAAAPIAAQSLANRIAAVREGTIRLSFASRPGVCGDGRGSVWIQDNDKRFGWNDRQYVCVPGPIRVSLGRADNQTVSVRKWVGGRWSTAAGEIDLGEVPAVEAARYLTTLAHTLGGGSGDEALNAAAFSDAGDLSAEFQSVVRDDDAPMGTRRQALFWLGQSDYPTRDLVRVYETLKPFALREHYTFVISQRHDAESVAKLIDVARTDPDLKVRKQAMFWLGQSKDPRAKQFFRDILSP